ncbi:MAG: glutaredoxin [Spirochaetales bacterium]|jgi:arsenate reductase|nr:glutaredoxin [Spirochaetales bacterium]
MQIYGTRKCGITKKAERFFRDRGIAYYFVNLAERGLSRGELENIRRGLSAEEALIDTQCPAYKKRGMAYMDYEETEEILADPLLLRTPVIREGGRVVIGDDEKAWKALAAEVKGR